MTVVAAMLVTALGAGAAEPSPPVSVGAKVNVAPVPPIDLNITIGQPTPPATPPAATPDPVPPTIESAEFESPPRVGRESTLVLKASSPNAPLGGYVLNLGESGSRVGAAACSMLPLLPGNALNPFTPGAPTTFEPTYTFRKAGEHTISYGVSTGFCTGQKTTRANFKVTVGKAPAKAAKAAKAAAGPGAGWLLAHAAQSGCSDDDKVPDDAIADVVANATVCLVNAERAKTGLPALAVDPRLATAATNHGRAMVQGRFFDHKGPDEPELGARGKLAGFLGEMGENIGYGTGTYASAKSIVEGWMDSPPHKANILEPRFKAIGIGIIAAAPTGPPNPGASYTANFGAEPPAGSPPAPAAAAAGARVCKPPNLKGKTLAAARAAIKKAGCQLGKVTKPKKVKKGRKLVVKKQSRKGNKINLTLGPK